MRASFRYLILANPVGALKPPAATTNQLSPRYVRLYARRGGSKALGLKVKVRSQVPPRRPRTALLGTSRPPPPRVCKIALRNQQLSALTVLAAARV